MKQLKPTRTIGIFLILAALLVLAACGPSAAAPTPAADSEVIPTAEAALSEANSSGYPAPTITSPQSDNPYPSGEQLILPPTFTPPSSYPPVATVEVFQEPRFRIDQPVSLSATEITGQSPPDTPLAIVDITYNGAILGVGRSDGNGRFTIPVTGLVEGNRIGLGIGELVEGQTIEQMAEFYFPYRGEGFMNIPNLGIYFDTALVTP